MQPILPEILLILGLILASGLLAVSELSIGAAAKSLLREWSSRGDRASGAALGLAEDPRRLLWTARAGMTALGTAAAVVGGATLMPQLSNALGGIPAIAPYCDSIAAGAVIVGITFASLVFSELVPRRVALGRPERVARLAAWPTRTLSILLTPLVALLSRATDLVLRGLGFRPVDEPAVTQEEISVMLEEGTEAGVLEEAEHTLIKRVFRFSDRRARALMTPRNEIVWIDVADTPDEIRRKVIESHHTRFPVCDQSLDNLLGIVHIKDFMLTDQNAEPFRIKGRLTLPLFIYEGTRGLKTLEMLKNSATRIAVVLDEYGTVEGLLTLTDILEAIVGDMPASADDDEPKAVQRDDGSWLLDGRMPLDEFRDLFKLTSVPEGDFHTLAGLVVTRLGHIPRISEGFDDFGLHFEVVDMDGNRVDRILVR
jgi:putative hemolysin